MPPDSADTALTAIRLNTRWDVTRYGQFEDARMRPIHDLLDRVRTRPTTVADLGCGPGKGTNLILRRWPGADVTGVDNSPDMLSAARINTPGARYVSGSVDDWIPPEPVDVIVASGLLHLIDNHEEILRRWCGYLSPGGTLAVQAPDAIDAPWYREMIALVSTGRFAGLPQAAPVRDFLCRPALLPRPDYHRILSDSGFRTDIFTIDYLHALTGIDAVFEWVSTTGLRPVLAGLPAEVHPEVREQYRNRLREVYPATATGTTLFPFRRIFMIAEP
ncbi:hypothetical protein AWN90_32290 [Nocardia terpenica]|uniref:Methyltransferase domain-containing protein n=3 Tax=Nocardia terpenica TaxID=455432 RepID=A0A164MGI0_9NOCA|nr:hypothetical protein AWN90_32290 [Nocardia terpenica]NQE87509.1 methyltransferase domain-containing protein [Nocardia terpenica]